MLTWWSIGSLETPTPKGSTEGGSVQQALRESKCFPYPSEIPISSSLASQNRHNRVSRLEPREVEPLPSAVQRRHDTFPEVSGACKMPAIAVSARRSISQEFRKYTQVAARLLHTCCGLRAHKVRDDRYSTNSLEAIHLSFVLGAFYKGPGLEGRNSTKEPRWIACLSTPSKGRTQRGQPH